MTQGSPENPGSTSFSSGQRDREILGLSTDTLAGLSIDELTGNKTAITMLVHYYKVLLDQNQALRNDLNTARSYVTGYDKRKTHATVGAILLLVANVGIGFGVNLLTSRNTWPGLATIVPGLVFAAAGTYFSMRDRKRWPSGTYSTLLGTTSPSSKATMCFQPTLSGLDSFAMAMSSITRMDHSLATSLMMTGLHAGRTSQHGRDYCAL